MKDTTHVSTKPAPALHLKSKPFFSPIHTGVMQKKEASFFGPSQTVSAAAQNGNGMPIRLKTAAEQLSGQNMDDVKVHYNSPEPQKVNALAYAQGNEVHLGSGQESHLPHEVWHVAQQKQGRVQPTHVQAKGVALNQDATLEKEADHMGEKLVQTSPLPESAVLSLSSASTVQRVMQRKEVPTNFGKFETTTFAEAEGRGVEITLKFHPDETKVDASKIGLSQSVTTLDKNGNPYAIDPNTAGRMVGAGKSGAGYYIDALSDTNNPLYGQNNNLGATKDLKDTPKAASTPANLGVNTNYELGYCYTKNPKDAKKTKLSPGLWDKPRGSKTKGESKMFETVALALDGTDSGKYYGSVKWGYKMEGTDAAPTVTKFDIEEVSKGDPSANFIEAAKLWNTNKTRGTVKVTADPEATVLKGDASGTEKLAKDKKLKQIETVLWGPDPAIKAEVLKDDGTGSGKIVYIKNSDAVDIGDGKANKTLPIPKP